MSSTSKPSSSAADVLGRLGLPQPITVLARKTWDVIVVGAGHNGLACASYLARAGKRVLVLESRDRVGGACTMEEPFLGVRFSPCAYVCGLLHPKVIDELDLAGHGFQWMPAAGGLFVPFEDGSSIQLWCDDERCEAEVRQLAPGDVKGWKEMLAVKARLRNALRPADDRDLWLEPTPTREEIDHRLGSDDEARALLNDWSMLECLERYIRDERLTMAYLGQGVIGTNASPTDPGTASVWYHHASGRMYGMPGTWGYVRGGMGTISFILADVARESGATIATGVRVARILPGEGVELESGERLRARDIVCNADPRVAISLLGTDVDASWRAKVEAVPIEGVTVKLNMTLRELPNFRARPGTNEPHHTGQVNTPLTVSEWKSGHLAANAGELPDRIWTELYLHSVYDPSVAPPGVHTLSVFAQYVPHTFARGTWDERRREVGERVIASIARFTTNLPDAILDLEVLGPPDIESRVGLTGGHIFQGDILPAHMWEKRLTARTPMDGVWLCGAATHPGGSVMGVNGRNAAFELLRARKDARS